MVNKIKCFLGFHTPSNIRGYDIASHVYCDCVSCGMQITRHVKAKRWKILTLDLLLKQAGGSDEENI